MWKKVILKELFNNHLPQENSLQYEFWRKFYKVNSESEMLGIRNNLISHLPFYPQMLLCEVKRKILLLFSFALLRNNGVLAYHCFYENTQKTSIVRIHWGLSIASIT